MFIKRRRGHHFEKQTITLNFWSLTKDVACFSVVVGVTFVCQKNKRFSIVFAVNETLYCTVS